jgi:hypothetical protein
MQRAGARIASLASWGCPMYHFAATFVPSVTTPWSSLCLGRLRLSIELPSMKPEGELQAGCQVHTSAALALQHPARGGTSHCQRAARCEMLPSGHPPMSFGSMGSTRSSARKRSYSAHSCRFASKDSYFVRSLLMPMTLATPPFFSNLLSRFFASLWPSPEWSLTKRHT